MVSAPETASPRSGFGISLSDADFELYPCPSGRLSQFAGRVGISIGGNLGFGNRREAADMCSRGFIRDVREHLLIAQIWGFLKHQLVLSKHAVIDGQGNGSNTLVLCLNLEAVLTMYNLRKHPEIS